MSSWKDLYSEVKKRKLEALNKKDVVKAVEQHGKILAINGRFEKPKKVIDHMYASVKKVIKPEDILKIDLNRYDVVLIGCPGDKIPSAAHPKIKNYVLNGGWLLTTDWVIRTIVELNFYGYIKWNEKKTDDAIVACQIIEPDHPFLDGVISEISQSKWQKQTKSLKKDEFRWWLENRSFPIQILNHKEVRILIASHELEKKWGEAPVLVYFDYGKKGGRVIHMISHTHLQRGSAKGRFASALILTNILDEKVSQKMGISKKATPGYVSNWEAPQHQTSPQSLEDQWVAIPQQDNYTTPSMEGSGFGLTGTSQIIEANDTNFSFISKCVYCEYDFVDYNGKIYLCKECGAPYHESCLNLQVNGEGTCKKCSRILLW
jgi:hypothetical protein